MIDSNAKLRSIQMPFCRIRQKITMQHTHHYGDNIRKHCCFVNWLYNHSSVLHERAEIIKCAEMLMQEDDFEICESILRQQKLLRERIDETLSEEIVQKCRNINGEYVWPWILPFSAAGMKHSSIQHQ